MKQRSFASLSFESKEKPTRRERFLGEMEKSCRGRRCWR